MGERGAGIYNRFLCGYLCYMPSNMAPLLRSRDVGIGAVAYIFTDLITESNLDDTLSLSLSESIAGGQARARYSWKVA